MVAKALKAPLLKSVAMEVRKEVTSINHGLGRKEVFKQSEFFPGSEAIRDRRANEFNGAIRYVAGIVSTLLVVRFVLLLFGAALTGFVQWVYAVTDPLVFPFNGIFASPESSVGRLDIATLVAIAVYLLLATGLTALVELISGRDMEEG